MFELGETVLVEKYFDRWNVKKKALDSNKQDLLFKEGEVWWCSIGQNIGEETFGKGENFRRPVVILKKLSRNSCVVLPITTKLRIGSWYHYLHTADKERWAMIHQIRFISTNRFSVKETMLADANFRELKKSVAAVLGL